MAGFGQVLSMCFILFTVVYASNKSSKRLVLNSQSYVQHQQDQLQIEIQNLLIKSESEEQKITLQQSMLLQLQAAMEIQNSTIVTQESRISQLEVQMGLQNRAITIQKSNITRLQSKIASQESTISSQNSRITSQQATISSLQANLTASRPSQSDGKKGTYFTIWGRTGCPGRITTVYSGYAGGSYYSHNGGAAEYICMPQDPIWGPHKYSFTTYSGEVYGAEYEGNHGTWGVTDFKQDVPCAVCQTSNFSMTMMIPGRTRCYAGWTEAYHGDLASGASSNLAPSQYVCVDQNPQVLPNGGRNDDGKMFCPVRAKCGSLRCPPYENDKMLSCVVCMK